MKLAMILLGAAVLTSCGVSLHPFYTAANLSDDPTLAGAWSDEDSTWTVKHTGFGKYTIEFCDRDDCTIDAVATLFEAGGQQYVDFQENPAFFSDAIRLHGLFQLQRMGTDRLEISLLETERMQGVVDHLEIEGRFLLTASPEWLQTEVLRAGYFGEGHLLKRN